jgi:LemA protein
MPTWLIVVIAFLVLVLLYLVSTYNVLVKLRNMVRDQWSQIDVQLKRRFDLIPNLVETVKGYAKHESETFEAVIKARNTFLSAKTPKKRWLPMVNLLRNVKLFALSENYPELKANTNFLQMQNDLKDVEDKIAYARQFYNDVVLKLNNKVENVPSNLVAGILK